MGKGMCADSPRACADSCAGSRSCAVGVCRRDFIKMMLAAGLAAGCSACVPFVTEPATVLTGKPTATPPLLSPTYWPTDGWRISTPEQQGTDSESLLKMLEFVVEERYDLHSILVIRNGYAVLEAYFYPSQQDTKDEMSCATRSFISALTGIAIEQGYIDGVEQKVLDFFPERSLAGDDSRKEAITLEHLLTSTSGWRVGRAVDERDPIQQMLDSPLGADPGTSFSFGVDPYLLSAILQQTVEMDALSFAHEHLFGPLGISDVSWDSDSSGVCIPTGLRLTPRDLAKLGYLYLNDGVWDGEQVVPAGWVAASLEGYANTGCGLGFGYQWWLHGFGAYVAQSSMSQCYAVPDLDLIVVSTSEPGGRQARIAALVEYLIMPAVKSSEPLPENPEGVTQLESLIRQVGQMPES